MTGSFPGRVPLAEFPQTCMRGDRLSSYGQYGMPLDAAIVSEWQHGMQSVSEIITGAGRFAAGLGRHGNFSEHHAGERE